MSHFSPTLGVEGFKQLPVPLFGSFERQVQNKAGYFQIGEKTLTIHLHKFNFPVNHQEKKTQLFLYVCWNTLKTPLLPLDSRGRELLQQKTGRRVTVIVGAKMFVWVRQRVL